MNLITVSGPPSSGKTSVIIKTMESLMQRGLKVGAVKFDCLHTDDDLAYNKAGIPVKKVCQGSYVLTITLYQISRRWWIGAYQKNSTCLYPKARGFATDVRPISKTSRRFA